MCRRVWYSCPPCVCPRITDPHILLSRSTQNPSSISAEKSPPVRSAKSARSSRPACQLIDPLRQLHRLRMRKSAACGYPMPRMIWIKHPVEAERHIIRVQCPAWFEIGCRLELHARTQIKSITESVVADFPTSGERGNHRARRFIERHQAVKDQISRCVGRNQGIVLNHIETVRTALRTHGQRLRGNRKRYPK